MRPRIHRLPPRFLAGSFVLLLSLRAAAVTETWDGNSPNSGAGDSNISTGLNWADNSAPVSDILNTDLVFVGTTKPAPNFTTALSAKSLLFNFATASFTLGGAGVTVGSGGISNLSANPQSFTNQVTIGPNAASFSATTSTLAFGGGVVLGPTSSLTLNSPNAISFASLAGAGTLTKSTAGTLTLNASSTVIDADLNLNAGVTTLAATGVTQIFSGTSTVTVGSSGTLNFNADFTLTGGAHLTQANGGQIAVAAGTKARIESGSAWMNGLFFLNALDLTVTGSGSTFQSTFDINLTNLSIQSGGTVSTTANALLTTTASVDGTASALSAAIAKVFASTTFSNHASGTFGGAQVTNGGAMQVVSGATLIDSGKLDVGTVSIPLVPVSGSLLVSGAGTTWQQILVTTVGSGAYSGSLTISNGALFTANGALVVEKGTVDVSGATLRLNSTADNSGTFTVSGGGSVVASSSFNIGANGTVNVAGGTLSVAGAFTNSGTLNFTSGALGINTLTVGTGGLLGQNLTLLADRQLTVAASTTVDFARSLVIDGGTFSTGTLTNNGTFTFTRGTFGITGAAGFNIGTGVLGPSVTLGAGQNLQVTNTTTVAIGSLLLVDGGGFTGNNVTNDGTIEHRNGIFNASGTLTNSTAGRLFVSGVAVPAGPITNAGRITLQDGVGLLGGAGAITNTGLITGDGTLAKPTTNAAGGELRAEAGQTLLFTGANGTNAGKLNLQGGTLEFTQAVVNGSAGTIQGRGALTFGGGLTNQGALNFSAGTTDISGSINMTGGAGGNARVIASGGSTTTFYNNVVHNGAEIRASTGSRIVFFGALSGAGPLTGGGTISLEGSYNPGNSPAVVSVGVNFTYSSGSTQMMELFGSQAGPNHPGPGDGYDKLIFSGSGTPQVSWDGKLELELGNGFRPQLGMTFDLFDFDNTRDAGAFSTLAVSDPGGLLAAGLSFDTSRLYIDGTLTVVPEPGTAALWWCGILGLAPRLRRRPKGAAPRCFPMARADVVDRGASLPAD